MTTRNSLNIKLLGSACVAICLGLIVYVYQDDASQQASDLSDESAQIASEEPKLPSLESINSWLESAKTSFFQKNLPETIELSGEAIAALEAREEYSSKQMMEAQLLNYKASFLNDFASKSMHDIRPDEALSFTYFNPFIEYAYQYFDKKLRQRAEEGVALFTYELPVLFSGEVLTVDNVQKREVRAQYTKEAALHSLKGKYRVSNKVLQTIAAENDNPFSEPQKAYYYLGREAMFRHRFALAENYFEKALSSASKAGEEPLAVMARDYLYHLSIRKKDKDGVNQYWLSSEYKIPNIIYQPELTIGDEVNLENISFQKIQLNLFVDEAGGVESITLNQGSSMGDARTLKLVKEMMLNSRFSPLRNAQGQLTNSIVKMTLQINPEIKKVLDKKRGKLHRTLIEFYPGAYNNRDFFYQVINHQQDKL